MLPLLSSAELQTVAALVVLAIIGKALGNETRLWLMGLTAAALSPTPQVLVAVAVISIGLRTFDLVKDMR